MSTHMTEESGVSRSVKRRFSTNSGNDNITEDFGVYEYRGYTIAYKYERYTTTGSDNIRIKAFSQDMTPIYDEFTWLKSKDIEPWLEDQLERAKDVLDERAAEDSDRFERIDTTFQTVFDGGDKEKA